MGHVLISPAMHSHPGVRRAGARPIASWTFSICWLSRNGRRHWFPRSARRELHATPVVTEKLFREGLWVDLGDGDIEVPQWVGRYGRQIQLWKFGPNEGTRPKIPEAIRLFVYERDGWACLHCGATANLSLDHIYPWSLGGPDEIDNLQTLCRSCNSKKGARIHAAHSDD